MESTNKIKHINSALFIPLCLVIFIVIAFFFSGRFILTNVVADKENKMRETLKIMGLTQLNYASSFLIVQGVISVFSAIIIGVGVF